MRRIKLFAGNTLWQLFPSFSMLLLALAVSNLFGLETWGEIVPLIAMQQIANAIVSWGNKDYLQRKLAESGTTFSAYFSSLFFARLLLFGIVAIGLLLFTELPPALAVTMMLLIFGRFVQQSFDILIIRDRRFGLILLLESAVFALQLAAIVIFSADLGLTSLILILAMSFLLKSVILLWIFRNEFSRSLKRNILKDSGTFAMLNLSGMLHGRIDLLVLPLFLSLADLGKYQVILTFLYTIQSLALSLSGPFVHNFYRLSDRSKLRFAKKLRFAGYAMVPLCIAVMFAILHFAFGFLPHITLAVPFCIFAYMSFAYLPSIYELSKRKLQGRTLLINLAGTVLLGAVLYIVGQLGKLHLETVFWLAALHQTAIAIFYRLAAKYPRNAAN